MLDTGCWILDAGCWMRILTAKTQRREVRGDNLNAKGAKETQRSEKKIDLKDYY
jgi:hypothetical protein